MQKFKELFLKNLPEDITYDEYKNSVKKMTKIERAKYKKYAKMLRDQEQKELIQQTKNDVLKARKRIIGK